MTPLRFMTPGDRTPTHCPLPVAARSRCFALRWVIFVWAIQLVPHLVLAQPADANGITSRAATADVGVVPQADPRSPGIAWDLNRLTDDELIDLYMAMSDLSLRSLVADQAALVDAGRCLIQLGYTFSYQEQDGLELVTHTVPELLVRYRLLERLEVRLAWAGVTFDTLTDRELAVMDGETRLSDPSVGGRWALWAQQGWRPRASVTISSPLNVDSNVSWANRLDPFVGLGYSWLFDERWLLSGSSAMVWTREVDERFLDFQQVVSIDRLLGDRWGICCEWTALFPEGNRWAGARQAVGPGLSFSLTSQVQLDWVTLLGLDEASPDVLTQFLVSWRF